MPRPETGVESAAVFGGETQLIATFWEMTNSEVHTVS